MLDRLEQMEQRYTELQAQFALPEVLNDHEKYQKIGRALREIEEPVEKFRELKQVRQGLADARAMLAEARRNSSRREIPCVPSPNTGRSSSLIAPSSFLFRAAVYRLLQCADHHTAPPPAWACAPLALKYTQQHVPPPPHLGPPLAAPAAHTFLRLFSTHLNSDPETPEGAPHVGSS